MPKREVRPNKVSERLWCDMNLRFLDLIGYNKGRVTRFMRLKCWDA